METVPNEILNYIMYTFLSLEEIKHRLWASKIFHVLTENQIKIIKNACQGWLKKIISRMSMVILLKEEIKISY
jgi:hypothetical protein